MSSRARHPSTSAADRRSGAEVLGDLLEIEVFLYVLLPVFFFPPRISVCFLRPDKRGRLCDGVPVRVGGLGILCTQLVNVGRGSRRGQVPSHSLVIAWLPFDRAPLRAQYSA
jgi:hypothetical protein